MEYGKIIVKVCGGLEKKNIPYMMIGGQAVLIYGYPRFTEDIDITLGVSIDDLKNIYVKNKDKIDFDYVYNWLKEFDTKSGDSTGNNFTNLLKETIKISE